MYLTAYHFAGDPQRILAGYETMMKDFPVESLQLHLSVVTFHGLSVFDGCPSYDEAVEFAQSDGFLKAIADAGLPSPRVEHLGEVHSSIPRVG
ncbi:hypothetical protein [Actinocrispum sp. NPDC049592]|uniref:hypothetical protein n=1 Tax=Actinocrispum sp. NPDC049592 TaxID=3154835 RepID=UPI003413A797